MNSGVIIFFYFSYPVSGAACLYRFISLILDGKKNPKEIMDNSRLQSQDDASYTLVSPTLTHLKGGSQVEGLQDEVFLHSSVSCGRIGYSDGCGFL